MFFGVSLLALAVMTAADDFDGAKRLQLLLMAIVLTAIAITTRLVGFARVPALVWACFSRAYRKGEPGLMTRLGKSLAAAALLVVARLVSQVRIGGKSQVPPGVRSFARDDGRHWRAGVEPSVLAVPHVSGRVHGARNRCDPGCVGGAARSTLPNAGRGVSGVVPRAALHLAVRGCSGVYVTDNSVGRRFLAGLRTGRRFVGA